MALMGAIYLNLLTAFYMTGGHETTNRKSNVEIVKSELMNSNVELQIFSFTNLEIPTISTT
jgi:hypothetical protein